MTRHIAILCIIAMVALSACSKTTPSAETATQENGVAQANAADAQAKEKTVTENCKPTTGKTIQSAEWTDATNTLALAVLKSQTGNAVASAYSAERALGMVLDGACGKTAEEMQNALALPAADNLSAAGHDVEKALLDIADRMDEQYDEAGNVVKTTPNVMVEIDNRVWLEKSYKIRDDYAKKIKNYYSAPIESVDFIVNHEEARKTINAHVAKATHDKIQDILPANSLDHTARLVLTNAVYFKAPWADPFNASMTDKADFITADGPVKVDMMHKTESFGYYADDNVEVVGLGFYGTSYDFIVIMPKLADGQNPVQALTDLEASLDATKWRELMGKISGERLKLSMPKFRIDATAELKKLLAARGMQAAFGRDADFSAISGSDDLFISDIYHKAFIEIDEKGADAAAATAVAMLMKAALAPEPPKTVNVDHPFMFAIVERNTSTALFMGRKIDFK